MPVRPLRLQWGMTTSHSIESTSRKIVWGALALFAVASAACGGGSPRQSMAVTAPSSLSAMSGAPDAGGAFGLMKEGKGKGPNGDTPTTPTAPGDDQDGGHGHGHATLQFEGFTSDITGTCPDLTIVINEETIVTNEDTDFQRAECADLKPETTTTTRRRRRLRLRLTKIQVPSSKFQAPNSTSKFKLQEHWSLDLGTWSLDLE